jgi:excisionase family DNA binding protein
MASEDMTVAQVAEYLRLPRETVYKYVRAGRLRARKSGGQWVFDRAEIDQWVEQNGNKASRPGRVLVVDDEPAIRRLFCTWLELDGFEAAAAANGKEALELMRRQEFGLVFLDLMMPEMNGPDTLRAIRTQNPRTNVVIVTGHYNSSLMEGALEFGPVRVLRKPVEQSLFIEVASAMAGGCAKVG